MASQNKAYDMVAAVALGQVVKGDKTDRDMMARLNEGTVSDLVELEGNEETGANAHTEVKEPSPFSKSAFRLGEGTVKDGGTYASVGHLYAHGNTDERYRLGILGVTRKGRKRDGPFNHTTGRGC
eukprot:5355928-Prymnesium_polylepis.1